MRIRPFPTLAALSCAAAVLASATAGAAEWVIKPAVSLRSGYNDNIRLETDNEQSSTEAVLSPSITFSRRTPSSELSSTASANVRRYLDESDLDDETGRLSLNAMRNLERSSLGLGVALIRDTTLDSQLEDTGLALDRVNRFRASINPSWSYSLSDRTSLNLGYGYTDISYENNADAQFIDSYSHSGQISLSRVINERSTGNITLAHSYSENDNNLESLFTTLQGGASYRFSETLSASLFAGLRHAETRYPSNQLIPILSPGGIEFVVIPTKVENKDDGYVFNGQISKQFIRGSMSVGASRDVNTDTSGFLVEVSKFTLGNTYRFSEKLVGGLQLQFYHSKTGSPDNTTFSRDYYTAAPSLTWAFDRFWRLAASYSYRRQTYDNSNDDAVQNAAYLTLTYDWPRIAVSR